MITIFDWFGYEIPYKERYRKIKEAGFDGTIDWTKTMQSIYQTNYSGAIALEVINRGYDKISADEFLSLAFKRAKRLGELRVGH